MNYTSFKYISEFQNFTSYIFPNAGHEQVTTSRSRAAGPPIPAAAVSHGEGPRRRPVRTRRGTRNDPLVAPQKVAPQKKSKGKF